jgi:hypothetical protein
MIAPEPRLARQLLSSHFPVPTPSDGHCFFRLSLYTVFSKQPLVTIKTMRRRDLLKGAVLLPAALGASADVPGHLWQGYNFGAGLRSRSATTRALSISTRIKAGRRSCSRPPPSGISATRALAWSAMPGGERSVTAGLGGSGNDRAARREDFELCALLRSFSRRRAASEIIPACSGSGRQSGRTQQCCGMLQIYGSVPVGPQD